MTVAAEPSGTQTNVPRSRRGRRGGLRASVAGLAAMVGVLFGAFSLPQTASAQGDFTAAITSGHDAWVDIGGAPATITVDVWATFQPGKGPKDVKVEGKLNGLDGLAWISVGGACTADGETKVKCEGMTSGEQRQVQFIVNPSAESDSLAENATQTGQFTMNYDGGSESTSVTVKGTAPARDASVTSINGQVLSNAEPVPDAKLVLTDGEGNEHEQTSGNDGKFEFAGNAENYIAPGDDMTLTVTKDGFEEYVKEDISVSANSSFTINVTINAEQTAAPTTEAAATTEAAPSPAAEETTDADEGGVSGTLIFLIVVGALLVVGGIVGIIFLLRGGKDNDDKDDGESFSEAPPEHTPTAAQVGSPGVYQAGPAPGSDAPTMIHQGGLLPDQAAPTQFGPAYGGADSTQVMPQSGFGAAPGGPSLGPDGTTILPVVKQPGGPGSDATQIMPQANLGSRPPTPPPSSFAADPGATRPHPSPTPPPTGGSMFDPQPPTPSQPPVSRDPYAPTGQGYASQPPSQSFGSQPPAQSFGSPPPPPGQPSAPSAGEGYPSQSMRRDPYAPPEQPPQPGGGQENPYGATRAMPQYGATGQNYGAPSAPNSQSYSPQPGPGEQPPATGYGAEPNREGEDPDSGRTDRKGWGEWDDRPRSW